MKKFTTYWKGGAIILLAAATVFTSYLSSAPGDGEQNIRALVYGRGSASAIESGRVVMTRTTCMTAAQNSPVFMHIEEGTVTIAGTAESHSVVTERSGSVSSSLGDCRHNDQGECLCELVQSVDLAPDIWNTSVTDSATGFVDDHTGVVNVTARASGGSEWRREALCRNAAREEGVAALVFQSARENGAIDVELPVPYTRILECKTSNQWNSCDCRVLVQAEDLRDTIDDLF